MSFINDGIVTPTTQPSGDTYGEKGLEGGDDPQVPSHPTPDPGSTVPMA